MTWNLTRFVGPSLPRCAFASTSRTLRARIGMMGASSSRRAGDGFLRRCDALRAADAVVGMLLLRVDAGDPAVPGRRPGEVCTAPAGGGAVTDAGQDVG